jgi:tRNA U34 5-methylaminomethyl-2-thiouridine-forming methyltransferase MnmC
MSALKIITTHDGSHSLLNEQLNETYHSIHGALQESKHVFIEHGLRFVSEKIRTIKILEIGFGTGLNALLTLQHALSNDLTIHYTTLEAFPVDETIWSNLNYTESAEAEAQFKMIHHAHWNAPQKIQPTFTLEKVHVTLQQVTLQENSFDLVYFDAFAPNKQPDMWELSVLQKVAHAMKPGATFVTYCAKGQLKRDLKSTHLNVEALPGPPGKREMIRAHKI